MANVRYISTGFWKDPYIEELDPEERLLFMYLLTNPNTNIAGIYEITIRQVAFDTGLEKEFVNNTFLKFERDGKIVYKRGWMALINWIKHQSINPKVALGIQRIIDNLPKWLYKELIEPDSPQQSLLDVVEIEDVNSLSKPIALNLTKLNLTKLNLTKLNLTAEAEDSNKFEGTVKTPEQKKSYAIAMEKERQQKAKAIVATERPASSPRSFDEIRKNIEARKKA